MHTFIQYAAIYAVHAYSSYLPGLAGASIFVHYVIPTCYEIGRD